MKIISTQKYRLLTWFVARNSSTIFFFSNDFINLTTPKGEMKFVSTFTTLKVSFSSKAWASFSACLSVSPKFTSDNVSRCVLLPRPSNRLSNFSSDIFWKKYNTKVSLSPNSKKNHRTSTNICKKIRNKATGWVPAKKSSFKSRITFVSYSK